MYRYTIHAATEKGAFHRVDDLPPTTVQVSVFSFSLEHITDGPAYFVKPRVVISFESK